MVPPTRGCLTCGNADHNPCGQTDASEKFTLPYPSYAGDENRLQPQLIRYVASADG